METPTNPTPEAMRATLNTLREARARTVGGEHQLRTLRHILCQHLDIPGAIGPLDTARKPVRHTDEQILELLYEGLLDFEGDSDEDDGLVKRARQSVATMLNKTPILEFVDGNFRIVEPPSAYAMA